MVKEVTENSSPLVAHQELLTAKNFTFNTILRGDCRIEEGATFTLFSDGSTTWRCDISSSDSGDEWDGFFQVFNAGGVLLFNTGNYHFDISDENVRKRWDDNRGPNGGFAAHFNEAGSISFQCSC